MNRLGCYLPNFNATAADRQRHLKCVAHMTAEKIPIGSFLGVILKSSRVFEFVPQQALVSPVQGGMEFSQKRQAIIHLILTSTTLWETQPGAPSNKTYESFQTLFCVHVFLSVAEK